MIKGQRIKISSYKETYPIRKYKSRSPKFTIPNLMSKDFAKNKRRNTNFQYKILDVKPSKIT